MMEKTKFKKISRERGTNKGCETRMRKLVNFFPKEVTFRRIRDTSKQNFTLVAQLYLMGKGLLNNSAGFSLF